MSAIIIRRRCSRSAAAYSRQTFPWKICLSVGPYVRACVGWSVDPVHCGKTADRIRMPFGIIGRTGPGMRQVVRFGDRSTWRGTLGVDLGRAFVTNGDFMAYVCDSAATRPSFQITLGKLVITIDYVASFRRRERRRIIAAWVMHLWASLSRIVDSISVNRLVWSCEPWWSSKDGN